ncbi:MAG TPA: hypothetical protein VFF52_14790 [Isosphaeraceae bacterium]|nr:hypothetical protein [Isosphaeraceae bacterium]
MSDPDFADSGKTDASRPTQMSKTDASKQPISPVRHAIGLVVLVAVLAIGWLEYSARRGYQTAVNALNERTQEEDKELMTVQEAENLLGKQPDGPPTDAEDGGRVYSKKTYTWHGLIRSYPLAAFYTKEKDARLHHFETEGAHLAAAPPATGVNEPPPPLAGAHPAPPAAAGAHPAPPAAAEAHPGPPPAAKTPPAPPPTPSPAKTPG